MIEILANDSLSIGLFPEPGADEKAPDHSTLTSFKNRLVNDAGSKTYGELFDEIIRIAQEKRVESGKFQKAVMMGKTNIIWVKKGINSAIRLKICLSPKSPTTPCYPHLG